MIKIKKDVKEPSVLHEEIRKEILKITGVGVSISIESIGDKIASVDVDDSNINALKKTKIKDYLGTL